MRARADAPQRPPGYFAWVVFDILGTELRRPCGWPAGPEFAAAAAFAQVGFGVAAFARIASRIPVRTLRYSSGWDTLDRVRDAVYRDLAG